MYQLINNYISKMPRLTVWNGFGFSDKLEKPKKETNEGQFIKLKNVYLSNLKL